MCTYIIPYKLGATVNHAFDPAFPRYFHGMITGWCYHREIMWDPLHLVEFHWFIPEPPKNFTKKQRLQSSVGCSLIMWTYCRYGFLILPLNPSRHNKSDGRPASKSGLFWTKCWMTSKSPGHSCELDMRFHIYLALCCMNLDELLPHTDIPSDRYYTVNLVIWPVWRPFFMAWLKSALQPINIPKAQL